ncbi:Ger(x)C family spore germination protein [Paenibacillus cremeus]|nr:Ger(x)C family spore germination protein [Paenibacillus cremeus]
MSFKRRMKLFGLCVLFSSLLWITGCWDMQNLEDIDLVNAIGMDYVDGQFVAYGQMVDFSAVSRQEGPKSTDPAIVWVGIGKGKTVNLAITDLYRTAQKRVVWAHVSSMILSERMINHGLMTMNDAHLRYRELRVTPWIYGTRESIEQLFTVQPFFNLSHLATLIHEPIGTYRQHSWVQPIRLLYLLSDLLEPGKTVVLPSLSIDKEQWKRNQEPDPKLEIDGAFIIHDNRYNGWLNDEKLRGIRWLSNRTRRSPIVVKDEDRAKATVSLENPSFEIESRLSGQNPTFSLHVKLKGNIVELHGEMSMQKLEQLTEAAVEKEIRFTYNEGLAIGSDLYQLENELYKQHYSSWQELTHSQPLALNPSSLGDIKVHLEITSTGMRKME